jgi:hypothetical protein
MNFYFVRARDSNREIQARARIVCHGHGSGGDSMHNDILEGDVQCRQLKRLAHVEAQRPGRKSCDFNKTFTSKGPHFSLVCLLPSLQHMRSIANANHQRAAAIPLLFQMATERVKETEEEESIETLCNGLLQPAML